MTKSMKNNIDKKEFVILVDLSNRKIGQEEKLKAHKEGKLHRAFSIFVFNSKGELLLQKRSLTKYHSPGLWSNTCCSHPRPGERTLQAAHRRLKEEMGFDCPLRHTFSITYKLEVGRGLIEYEYDYIFFGKFDGNFKPNPQEVADYKWVSLEELKIDVKRNSKNYTEWFKLILNDSRFWKEVEKSLKK